MGLLSSWWLDVEVGGGRKRKEVRKFLEGAEGTPPEDVEIYLAALLPTTASTSLDSCPVPLYT